MPGPHRRFLEDLSGCANIRDYVEANTDNPSLAAAYDECLRALSSFRDKHLQIVSRYIIVMSQESKRRAAAAAAAAATTTTTTAATTPPPSPTTPPPTPTRLEAEASDPSLGLAKGEAAKRILRGTGGTKLMPFLKQSRDETMEPATGAWSKMGSKFESYRARSRNVTPLPTPGSTPRSSSPINGCAVRSCKVNDFEDIPVSARVGVGMAGDWEMDDVGGICHY